LPWPSNRGSSPSGKSRIRGKPANRHSHGARTRCIIRAVVPVFQNLDPHHEPNRLSETANRIVIRDQGLIESSCQSINFASRRSLWSRFRT
jgi:hypothetical protein